MEAIFKTQLKNGAIKVPREILEMLGFADSSELIVVVSGDKIVVRPYRESPRGVDKHIEWLRENAPECFSEDEVVVRSKWVSIDWMRRKLGLKH